MKTNGLSALYGENVRDFFHQLGTPQDLVRSGVCGLEDPCYTGLLLESTGALPCCVSQRSTYRSGLSEEKGVEWTRKDKGKYTGVLSVEDGCACVQESGNNEFL